MRKILNKSNYSSSKTSMQQYVNSLFFHCRKSISGNRLFEKNNFFIENSIEVYARNVDVRIIEKSSTNDDKMESKSIEKSRSEKGRSKIEKNRRLERPKVEKAVRTNQWASRFRASGSQDRGIKGTSIVNCESWMCDPTRRRAEGPANI